MQPIVPPDSSPASIPSTSKAPGPAGQLLMAAGSPPSDPTLTLELKSAQRGLQILQAALLITLVSLLASGALRAYWMELLLNHRSSDGPSSDVWSMLFGGWQLIFFATSVAELVALSALASSPQQARVAEQARGAMLLQGLSLLLSVITFAVPKVLSTMWKPHEVASLTTYLSYGDTLLSLFGTILTIEVLLRLRCYAAPPDLNVTASVGLQRGGLIAALLVRTVVGYASYVIAGAFLGSAAPFRWLAFAIRVPFNLVFYGLFLWLVQATRAAVQTAETRCASGLAVGAAGGGAGPAEAVDQGSAGLRNVLLGSLWAVGGLAVTLATYSSAQQLGGRYMIAYGAIIGGVLQFIRGLAQLSSQRSDRK